MAKSGEFRTVKIDGIECLVQVIAPLSMNDKPEVNTDCSYIDPKSGEAYYVFNQADSMVYMRARWGAIRVETAGTVSTWEVAHNYVPSPVQKPRHPHGALPRY